MGIERKTVCVPEKHTDSAFQWLKEANRELKVLSISSSCTSKLSLWVESIFPLNASIYYRKILTKIDLQKPSFPGEELYVSMYLFGLSDGKLAPDLDDLVVKFCLFFTNVEIRYSRNLEKNSLRFTVDLFYANLLTRKLKLVRRWNLWNIIQHYVILTLTQLKSFFLIGSNLQSFCFYQK